MNVNFQFKDGVAFAYVIGNSFIEGSVQVETENPDGYLNKTIDENGNWIDAPLIRYALVNEDGQIREIRTTYFPSEVKDNPIMPEQAKDYWTWNGTEFVPPVL